VGDRLFGRVLREVDEILSIVRWLLMDRSASPVFVGVVRRQL
jgi:hypothetical protein